MILNLTNKQVIDLLAKEDPNAIATVVLDSYIDGVGYTDYPELENTDDGTFHYDTTKNLLVVNAGYFG